MSRAVADPRPAGAGPVSWNAPSTDGAPRLNYVPALDGLRAVAVIAVLLYHGAVHSFGGGFLGVDVFFVISGYLITCLLLGEWRSTGRVQLRRFWLRRARRLLPALLLVLAAVALFTLAFLPDEVSKLQGQTFAALGYGENWYLIFHHQSYFESFGRPPLLQHLWSLAVEEQFYLLWPLLLTAGLRRWGKRRTFKAVVIGGAVSTLLMAVLYRPGSDPSRVYYGTDTRAVALLVGAALAFVWAPWRLRRPRGRIVPVLYDLIGLAGVFTLVWMFTHVGQLDHWLYQGGFAVVALVTMLVIAMAVH